MHKKPHVIATVTFALSAIGIVALYVLVPPHLPEIIAFTKANPLLAPLILILWRIVAIVIPPIPGGIVSLAVLPIFGWFWTFIYSFIGMVIGSTIAFFIARYYREPVVKHFVPLQQMHKWEGKLSSKTEFFGFLTMRFITSPVFDFMSYIAGLSKISFWKFFLATLITLIPDALVFYLGDTVYKSFYQENPYAGILALIIFGVVLYVLSKKRFFSGE